MLGLPRWKQLSRLVPARWAPPSTWHSTHSLSIPHGTTTCMRYSTWGWRGVSPLGVAEATMQVTWGLLLGRLVWKFIFFQQQSLRCCTRGKPRACREDTFRKQIWPSECRKPYFRVGCRCLEGGRWLSAARIHRPGSSPLAATALSGTSLLEAIGFSRERGGAIRQVGHHSLVLREVCRCQAAGLARPLPPCQLQKFHFPTFIAPINFITDCLLPLRALQSMFNFLSGHPPQPRTVRTAKWAFALLAAATAGFLAAGLRWQQDRDWAEGQALTAYDCEDQVNTLIEKTGRPAVLYYYLPASPHHPLLRALLLQQAHRHPHNAHWVMVNLTQHLHPAKEALSSIVYPLNQARIEIRFPKTQLAVYETSASDELKLLRETTGHRRQVYNYGLTRLQFQAFLEEHGVIEGSDPMAGVLEVTRKAIFES